MPRARLLGGILLLSVLVSPWGRELFVGDETKYGQVVREMRTTGAFFLPTLGGTPFTHKPPLHFWLIDLLTFVFGVYSTWAFVLPSIAAYAFLLWLMNRMGGPLAMFVCGTSLLVWGSAQTARMDVSFTALIALGCWLMARFFDRDDFRALLGAGLALAAATLIKGPMAPVIALVLFALEAWRRRRLPRGNYLPALAALIVIPLLWLVPALLLGGQSYARDVLMKQTVGRAVSSWTHNAPPWFYLLHSPGILFPWFFLAALAIARRWRARRFEINWILAVLVPYSLLASKLDVYMMALIPPVAVVIADFLENDARFARGANVAMLVLLALIGAARFFVPMPVPVPRMLFVIFIVSSLVGLIASRISLDASTFAVGFAVLAPLVYAALFLMPLANEQASTRPLVSAILRQRMDPEEIYLYSCPWLWTRDMPRALEHVQYERRGNPPVIITARKHASEIDLRGYRRVDTLRMIGKDFDVYRR